MLNLSPYMANASPIGVNILAFFSLICNLAIITVARGTILMGNSNK